MIKILSDSPQTKGKTFEMFMVNLFDHLGYTDFKLNIRPTGMELDIEATHKTNKEKLLVECKAHESPIASPVLVDFLGKFTVEKHKRNADLGIFVSISGYSSTAERYYKEMNKKTKKDFFLWDSKKIIKLLIENKIIMSTEELEAITKKYTNYPINKRYFVYYQSQFYFIQILGKDVTSYIILSGDGKIVSNHIMNEISKLDEDIINLQRINPEIIKKIELSLLNLKEKTLKEISNEIVETEDNCYLAIKDIESQNIIISRSENEEHFYSINKDLSTLRILGKGFLDNDVKYDFMSSSYIGFIINGIFLDDVLKRYHLNLSAELQNNVILSAKIFPSVLSFYLFGDVDSYEYSYNRSLEIGDPAIDQINQIRTNIFFQEIFNLIFDDIRKMPIIYMNKKELKICNLAGHIKLGSESKKIFELYVKSNSLIVNKGSFEAKQGEILSPQDISQNIETGLLFYHIDEYDEAIKFFDNVIQNSSDHELLSYAFNNKAQCYRMQSLHNLELDCLNSAEKFDSNLKVSKIRETILKNKKLCLTSLSEINKN